MMLPAIKTHVTAGARDRGGLGSDRQAGLKQNIASVTGQLTESITPLSLPD